MHSAGRVPQAEGARLLGACDVFVSPHNSHMVDSRFFGSPTKLFEYMAMGQGIVCSDLEQLGEVLSPALRVRDVTSAGVQVGSERAVLCTPGDVGEFVAAVVALVDRPDIAAALGRNARQAVLDTYSWQRHVENIWRFVREHLSEADVGRAAVERVDTGDAYKEQVQDQWNNNPVGTHYATATEPHTREWFEEVEAHRYGEYAPWMPSVMEFDRHAGHDVLEIGGGIGTDLSRFARHGARVTDLDLSGGHLELAQENFARRNLQGRFVHHDAERLPFDEGAFDLVYSNGVLHHTPNTRRVVEEIRRVLKPGGKAIVMMYAEDSIHYWRELVWRLGLERDMLKHHSMGEIMSRSVEISQNDARPLVKVYTAARLKKLFEGFDHRVVYKRQLMKHELPGVAQMDAAGSRRPAHGMERDHQGHQEPGVMLSRLSKWLRRVTAADAAPTAPPASASAPALGPPERWADQLALANLTRDSWLEGRRAAGRLYADLSDDEVISLAARCPAQGEQTRASAERVLRHEFDLLGSGWRAVVDPTRPPRTNGYRPIDWAVDPIAGLRFPTGFTYSDWNPADASRPRRHQMAVGDRPLPALDHPRPGVPAHGRRTLRGGDRRSARRLHGGQPGRHRRPVRVHDGHRHSCAQLGDRLRADSQVGSVRRAGDGPRV